MAAPFMSKISMRVLTPSLVGPTMDCVMASFGRDPFSNVMHLGPQDWAAMSGMFIERAADRKPAVSLVAWNKETQQVDGVLVNEDWKEKPPQQYWWLAQDWDPVKGIFQELQTKYKKTHPETIDPGDILHALYFSCVRPEARKKGILTAMWRDSIEMAQDYHFQFMCSEASNPAVAAVCERLGFQEKAAVDFASFLHKGENRFFPLAEQGISKKISLYERPITSGLVV